LNKEFRKRWESALQILSILAPEAKKRKQTLIFLGGSAVQSSLHEPRRVSIDLDVYYSGDKAPLIELLEKKGYQVQERPSRNKTFSFYTATLNDVIVKIDFLNADIFMGQPKRNIAKRMMLDIKGNPFYMMMAKPAYLMASKFASLAIGTVGRKPEKDEPTDLLKDVYDLDCLIEEFGVLPSTWKHYERIIKMQNKLWGTKFNTNKVNRSVEKTLLEIGSLNPAQYRITDGNLGNFNEYLVRERVKRYNLVRMAYRLLMHLKIAERLLKTGGNPYRKIRWVEGYREKLYDDEDFLSNCEAALKNRFDAKELHQLKIIDPDALIFLYFAMVDHAFEFFF
jgi:hypothetical protein